jgi:hypothetical protein
VPREAVERFVPLRFDEDDDDRLRCGDFLVPLAVVDLEAVPFLVALRAGDFF